MIIAYVNLQHITLGMFIPPEEHKNTSIYYESQRSFDFNRGQSRKALCTVKSNAGMNIMLVMWVHVLFTWSIFIVEYRCRLSVLQVVLLILPFWFNTRYLGYHMTLSEAQLLSIPERTELFLFF